MEQRAPLPCAHGPSRAASSMLCERSERADSKLDKELLHDSKNRGRASPVRIEVFFHADYNLPHMTSDVYVNASLQLVISEKLNWSRDDQFFFEFLLHRLWVMLWGNK